MPCVNTHYFLRRIIRLRLKSNGYPVSPCAESNRQLSIWWALKTTSGKYIAPSSYIQLKVSECVCVHVRVLRARVVCVCVRRYLKRVCQIAKKVVEIRQKN